MGHNIIKCMYCNRYTLHEYKEQIYKNKKRVYKLKKCYVCKTSNFLSIIKLFKKETLDKK